MRGNFDVCFADSLVAAGAATVEEINAKFSGQSARHRRRGYLTVIGVIAVGRRWRGRLTDYIESTAGGDNRPAQIVDAEPLMAVLR